MSVAGRTIMEVDVPPEADVGAVPRVSDESMSLVNCDPPTPAASSTTSPPESD